MSFDCLKEDNLFFLQQGLDLLRKLDDHQFAAQPQSPMSSVGGHLRHCIDFYARFLDGMGDGKIDYDARTRDPRLEIDRSHAADIIAHLMERLSLLGACDQRPLRVSMDRRGAHEEPCWATSSVERELQFLRSHTVHHYALISASLHQLGVPPEDDFGVAPATLAYRQQMVTG